MGESFPRTQVESVSLSRMIIGTNWILGYSHRSPAADRHIKNMHEKAEATAELLETFLHAGIDTMMGVFGTNPTLQRAVAMAQERTGRKLILIDTPVINVSDHPNARREAQQTIAQSAKVGATFCFPHHSSAEQLVNKHTKTVDRLEDYLAMIRDHDMIPGLSCHMPELILYSDMNEYDVQTYIQIYNCMGFLMQVEIEYIHKVIWGAKKPVMTIKPMAAGRVSPFVGLNFVWNTIRPCDMVTVGCMTKEEALEDIEISKAALERRPPNIAGRNSPNKTEIMKDD